MDPRDAFLQANGLTTPLYPPGSRYHGLSLRQHTLADGTVVSHSERRFLPQPDELTLLQEHRVEEGERIDAIAARYLGDPLQYWRIADANGAMRPAELTETIGRRLRITLPEGIPGVGDAN